MTPADQLAIGQLLAQYSYTVDSGDSEGWAECFTEDGSFEGKAGRFQGRDALQEFAARRTGRGRHLVGNLLIRPDETDSNRAEVLTYMIYYEVRLNEPQSGPAIEAGGMAAPVLLHTTVQRDQVVKVNGQWKIHERKITIDEPGSRV